MHARRIEPLEARIAPANIAYAVGLGGSGNESVQDIGVDASGNTYVSGKFQGTVDFDPGTRVEARTAAAGTEVGYVAKYTSAGALAWVDTITPETGLLSDVHIAVAASGDVFVGGDFTSTAAPVGSSLTLRDTNGIVSIPFPQTNALANLYVLKIAPNGRVQWANYVDPANPVGVEESDIATDGAGGVYVTGTFASVGAPGSVLFGGTALATTRAGDDYLYVTKLQDNGNAGPFLWAAQSTSTANDPVSIERAFIAVDANGLAGVAGKFTSALTFSDPGTTTVTDSGTGVFVGRLATNGAWTLAGQFGQIVGGGVGRDVSGVAIDSASHMFVAGEFQSVTDFDIGPGLSAFGPSPRHMGYLVRLAPNGALDFTPRSYFGPDPAFATDSAALTLDSAGNAYVSFENDHPVVVKFDGAGNIVETLDLPGVNGDDGFNAIAVDSAGGVHIATEFTGIADLDPGPGTATLTNKGQTDVGLASYFPGNLVRQPLQAPFAMQGFAVGSVGEESGRQILTDAAGNIFVAGLFNGTVDFDPGPAVVSLTSKAGADDNIFVAKYTSAGALTWANLVQMDFRRSGAGQPAVHLALDDAGNVYLAGEYHGQATLGALTLANADPVGGGADLRDVFVAKLDSAGTFLWADNISGAGKSEFVTSLEVRGSTGQVVLSGSFETTVDFDPGAGTANRTPISGLVGRDPFILSLNTAGAFQWVRQLGGTGTANAGVNDLAFLSTGDVAATGFILGTIDFNLGGAADNLTSTNLNEDAFVARFSGGTGTVAWKQKFGGTRYDIGFGVAVGAGDTVFAGGFFSGSVDFDPGAGVTRLVEAGSEVVAFRDGFLVKLASNGTFQDAAGFGGPGEDRVSTVRVGAGGDVFVSGRVDPMADVDPGAGIAILPAPGVFLSRFTSNLDFVSARPLGDDHWHVDAAGNVFVTGDLTGTEDFDPSTTPRTFTSKGQEDFYVLKLAADGDFDAAHPRTFHDADGDVVSVTVTGPGTAHYSLNGGAQHMADLDQLTLTGTALASAVNVGVTKFGTGLGTSTAQKILTTEIQQHLGSLTLGSAFRLGDSIDDTVLDLHVSGKLNRLVLGDLSANTIIRLGDGLPYNAPGTTTPDTYNNRPDVTIGRVTGDGVQLVVLGADAPLSGPNAGIGTAGDATHPGGGGLGRVLIGGWEFDGFIRTTQSIGDFTVLNSTPVFDGTTRVVLEIDKYHRGTQNVANCGTMTIQNGAWGSSGSEIEGDIEAFSAEEFLAGATLTAANIGKVLVDGDFDGTVTLTDPDTLPSFTVTTDFNGTVVSAGHLKRLNIKGDFKGSLEALSIGSITAYSFLGSQDIMGVPTTYIRATDGPLGTLTTISGPISDFTVSTPLAFKGFKVVGTNLTADTIGLDNVHITATSIGNISVNLKSKASEIGVDLIGIRDSTFETTAAGATRATAGNIGSISVTLTGAAGGTAAYGIVNTTFDALVGNLPTAASTVNAIGNINVKISGQGGINLGLSSVSFLANGIGTTTVNVTRPKVPGSSTAQGMDTVDLTASGAIGTINVNGDATLPQVSGLEVWAGGTVGAVTVKSKTPAMGTLQDSAILAGQLLSLAGDTAAKQLAALGRAKLGAVNVSGSILNTDLIAGGAIGAVAAGYDMSDSLIFAGAMLGGDFTIDGNDTYHRAAAIAAVTVKGAFTKTSVAAGVDPGDSNFGNGNDIAAALVNHLTTSSSIGPITLAAGSTGTPAGPTHLYGIEAAKISALKLGAVTMTSFAPAGHFLDHGTPGEDGNDVLVRII